MLSVPKMIASAEACLGWPYVSPGTNDQNGIDCSGLFVRIFRDQGASIYHGSNTIYREYCTEDKGKITAVSKLQPGMAVFKHRDKTPDKFKDDLGDFHHIGLVVSASPKLKIIHASSVSGKVITDTKIGKWAYFGSLKNVDYGATVSPVQDISEAPSKVLQYATVVAKSRNVKMRLKPSTKSALYDDVPVGSIVEITERGTEWSRINYGQRTGWYMMNQFLRFDDGTGAIEVPEAAETGTVYYAGTVVGSGASVKMRNKPSTKCRLYDDVPVGSKVVIVGHEDGWYKINYGIRMGWYMMDSFIQLDGPI